MNVQESWNVTQIEQTDVPQINRLLEKHLRRNHAQGDEVPDSPHVVPIFYRGHAELGIVARHY